MDTQGKGKTKALKLVLDTNTMLSGFLWSGNEAKLLEQIDGGKAQIFFSEEIIEELEGVAGRTKFKEILLKAGLTVA